MKPSVEYKDCLEYIDSFWGKVTVRPRRRDKITNIITNRVEKQAHKNILHVPHSFIVPNTSKFTYVFYWDSFFMFKGLLNTKRQWIMMSMVENFLYLYKKYGSIPNFNSPGAANRSQPPLLTSMILDVYFGEKEKVRKKNIFWLERAAKIAKNEYFHVWIDSQNFFHHSVPDIPLNRYGDRDIGYAHSSELESGWDFTSRFYNRCDEFLPIDLNVFLYKYERDFAKISALLKNKSDAEMWQERADTRKKEINDYMWDEKTGFFYDYGYAFKKRSDFLSLAGFTPLWTGLATPQQAKKMVKMLKVFESPYGLFITAKKSLPPKINLTQIPTRYRSAINEILEPKQWDYPHIWPPLEYLTVIGLLKYGYVKEAVRIMKKSLKAEAKIFRKHGTFFEKIDGESGDVAKGFHYPNQGGFGWTNAVFYRYVQILEYIDSRKNLYLNDQAPYELSFPH